MGLFGRLMGKPPTLPVGARAYVDDGFGGSKAFIKGYYFVVKVRLGAELTPEDKTIGPSFKTNGGAQMYADWLNHEGDLNWNINGPGMPV